MCKTGARSRHPDPDHRQRRKLSAGLLIGVEVARRRRQMRALAMLCLLGCAQPDLRSKPSLEGSYSCGATTCTSGQVCLVMEAGSQCGVDLDAGVGPYQEYGWTCLAL